MSLRRRSFFLLVRNRAVKLLIDKVGRGASGMCEAIVPALLLLNDMTVGDLNQFGKEVYRPDTFSCGYHFVAFLQDKKSVLYHPSYGFLTRRGFIHWQYRARKLLHLTGFRAFFKKIKALIGKRYS